MKSFTDADVLEKIAHHHHCAKESSKQGPGTGRAPNMSGLAGAEWMRWRAESRKRGLIQ